MNKKILATAVLVIILGGIGWYLLIKDYNYKISFKTNQPPGVVYAVLSQWQNLNLGELDELTAENIEPYRSLVYEAKKNDSAFRYRWKIKELSDDTTYVTAYVKDQKNNIAQNLTVPFKRNEFIERSTTEVRKVMEYLKVVSENFNVEIIEGQHTVPSKYVAFLSIDCKISDKARHMRENIGLIMGYIKNNDMELTGYPFIKVTELNNIEGTITFDFCFPIEEKENMPATEIVKFKRIDEFKALKANFNGNYRSTEFAWYELLRYAEENDISILEQPTEIFNNDPQSGTNSKDWLAEVYLPIK